MISLDIPNSPEALDWLEKIYQEPLAHPSPKTYDSVILYGAGALGQMAIDHLRHVQVPIEFILDRTPSQLQLSGYPIYRLDSLPDGVRGQAYQAKMVLISTVSAPFERIRYDLNQRGWSNVLSFYDFAQNYTDLHPINNGWFSGELTAEDRQGIQNVLLKLSDDASRGAYLQSLAWRIIRQDWICEPVPVVLENRYFIDDMLRHLGREENLVDVGAYDGRVLTKFLKYTEGNIRSALLVEPDIQNLKLLKTFCEKLPAELRQRVQILEGALLDQTGEISFSHGFDMASKPGSLGSMVPTPCFRLDDLDVEPTFLKIHTEGSELSVLLGAKTKMTRFRPKITTTLYHSRDGLWKIPHFLMELLPDYHFYFRLHSWCGTGSVIYAIPKESRGH